MDLIFTYIVSILDKLDGPMVLLVIPVLAVVVLGGFTAYLVVTDRQYAPASNRAIRKALMKHPELKEKLSKLCCIQRKQLNFLVQEAKQSKDWKKVVDRQQAVIRQPID